MFHMNCIIKAVPNTITSCNLLSGAIATYFASTGRMDISLALIVLAAIFDFLDGTAARLLGAYSKLGVQLDSLADMISFGLAPSMAMFTLLNDGNPTIAFGAFLLSVFAALRLGKFNIDETQKHEFHGLPTPAMSLFVFSYAWTIVNFFPSASLWLHWAVVIIFSALMVCPLPMFSLKFSNLKVKDNIVRYVFLLFAVIAILLFCQSAFAVIIPVYVLTSIVVNIFSARKK